MIKVPACHVTTHPMAAWSTSDSDGAQQTVASPVAWLVEPTVTPDEPSNLLDLDISQVKKEGMFCKLVIIVVLSSCK